MRPPLLSHTRLLRLLLSFGFARAVLLDRLSATKQRLRVQGGGLPKITAMVQSQFLK